MDRSRLLEWMEYTIPNSISPLMATVPYRPPSCEWMLNMDSERDWKTVITFRKQNNPIAWCRPACCWLWGEGPWAMVIPVKAIKVGVGVKKQTNLIASQKWLSWQSGHFQHFEICCWIQLVQHLCQFFEHFFCRLETGNWQNNGKKAGNEKQHIWCKTNVLVQWLCFCSLTW